MRAKAVGLLLCGFALLGASGEAVGASADAPACHGYRATAHTGDFDLSVCRSDDDEAIDEAIALVSRISGDARYVESVSVVYFP